jgi:hypothetical protein
MSLFKNASSTNGFPALDDLPWKVDPEYALSKTRELLSCDQVPKELVAWLVERPTDDLELIFERSLERTTHYKWFLGGRVTEYIVWIHEYKPPALFDQAVGFAASVHNHRYGFCSRVLCGALYVSTFAPPRDASQTVRLTARRQVDVGETMALTPEDVHRIDQVAPHTYTILVQGPKARDFSTCYDSGGFSRRIYDMQSRLPQVLAMLAGDHRRDMFVAQ